MNNKNINFRKITYPGIPSNRYMISEDGKHVFDTLKNKSLKFHTDKDGYYRVSINRHGYGINRLVAYEFCLKNRDLSLVVDHVDGNKQNNHYTNLEWVTVKENTNRAIKMGLINRRGENCNTNIYPESFVHEICQMFVNGMNNMEVLNTIRSYPKNKPLDYEKDKSLYGLIVRLRKKAIWPDVVSQYEYETSSKSKKIFLPTTNSRFSEKDIHFICKQIVDGKCVDEILSLFNIFKSDKDYKKSADIVRSIRVGRNWTSISSQYFESRFRNSGRNRYNFDDLKLSSLLDKRFPIELIYREFGISMDKKDRLIRRAIRRRIENYSKINNIENYKDISLSEEDLYKLEDWAATW